MGFDISNYSFVWLVVQRRWTRRWIGSRTTSELSLLNSSLSGSRSPSLIREPMYRRFCINAIY